MSDPERRSEEERSQGPTEEDRRHRGPAPPGHFLSHDLEADTARFLEEVKRRVGQGKTPPGSGSRAVS